MTIEEALQINHIYGGYLANSFGKLNLIFIANIPQSFLPYPPDILSQAYSMLLEYYKKYNDKQNIDNISFAYGALDFHIPDHEAVNHFIELYNDSSNADIFLDRFKKFQSEYIQENKDWLLRNFKKEY